MGIAEFSEAKADWLETFLELPNGIPSADTFKRVFEMLDPEEFQCCFINMVSAWACETSLVLGQAIGLVEAERHLADTVTKERRFFIASLDGQADQFAHAVRNHWHIENRLHWVLDIASQENQSRLRKGFAAQNMAILRQIALNLLGQDRSKKCGIKNKCLIAGWDHNFLLHLLNLS